MRSRPRSGFLFYRSGAEIGGYEFFVFKTKDYKLPKGVTFDYDDGSAKKQDENLKNRKGKVEITYTEYLINKGVDDAVFKQ